MELELTLVCKSALSGACTVRWEDETGRYHVWFNRDGDLEDVLYKAPPSPITFGDDDFFNIRRLDVHAACHAEVIKRVCRLASKQNITWAIQARVSLDSEELVRDKTYRAEKVRQGLLAWVGNQSITKSAIHDCSEDRLLTLPKLLKY